MTENEDKIKREGTKVESADINPGLVLQNLISLRDLCQTYGYKKRAKAYQDMIENMKQVSP